MFPFEGSKHRRAHGAYGPFDLTTTAIVVLVTTLFAACGGHHEEAHEGHAQGRYPATTPLMTDTVVQRDLVCQIHSVQHIEVRALEKGYLQDILVDEGQRVREGQMMFRIRPVVYQAEVQRAQAEVEFAGIEYRNTQALADSNIVSPNELALAKARLNKAKAELSMAEAHLAFTDIRAPFDGIVGRFHVRKGSLLDEGELLTELSDNSSMWVYFNVPEANYLEYEMQEGAVDPASPQQLRLPEANIELRLANGKIFDQTAGDTVTVESNFDNETGNIQFRADFSNPKGLLRHGQTGTLLIHQKRKDAVVIPQRSTFEILDKQYVYVVGEDDIVHQKAITVAHEQDDIFVVDSGVMATDRIVIEGVRQLHDGDHVKYEYKKPEEVLAHLKHHAE